VGIHDHFLELGGDSLIATQIASRILDRLGVEITLVSLFKRPTVSELAAEISSSGLSLSNR
jgi:surfactin family lipopeptide synthetase A